ncbi:MAG: hypothetical protein REI78_15120 [Pedobacter sp.]|nr:hypothetical protein [Pedobacter sp.]MDQ8054361.1 hypothetical protein [Pedobacter sp.]
MKKLLLTLFASAALFTAVQAQDYKNGLGLGLDFGNGATLVGPSFKHFFTAKDAGQAEVVFGNHTTAINVFYQYHGDISGASGLKWFVGGGPSLHFFDYAGFSNTTFALKPMAGLDFKISGAPIAFAFDWRPSIFFGDSDTDFEAGRFGLGFRYTF